MVKLVERVSEEPGSEGFVLIGVIPGVVADPGIFGEFGFAPGGIDRGDGLA